MTYAILADGPVHGQESETMVPHSVMVSQIEAAVLAERERCFRELAQVKHMAMVHEEARATMERLGATLVERERCAGIADDCFKRGVWPGEIEAKIRSAE